MTYSPQHLRKDCDGSDIRLIGNVLGKDGTEKIAYQCLNCGIRFYEVWQDDETENNYVRAVPIA